MTDTQDKKPLITVKPSGSTTSSVTNASGEESERVIYTGQQAYKNGRSVGGGAHPTGPSGVKGASSGDASVDNRVSVYDAGKTSASDLGQVSASDLGQISAAPTPASQENQQPLDEDGYPIQTLDDLNAKGPYEKTRVAVLVAMAVLVIAFIIYWVTIH